MTMETLRRGWKKIHKGCGGPVRFVECLIPVAVQEWDFECVSCGRCLMDVDVEFVPLKS